MPACYDWRTIVVSRDHRILRRYIINKMRPNGKENDPLNQILDAFGVL